MNLKAEMEKRNMTEEHLLEYIKFEDEWIKRGFTLNQVLDSMEKAEPHKPEECRLYADRCKCGRLIWGEEPAYCKHCGQKLDWSN